VNKNKYFSVFNDIKKIIIVKKKKKNNKKKKKKGWPFLNKIKLNKINILNKKKKV